MRGHFHYQGEEYCEFCLPVGEDNEEVDLDTGEQDSPAHCSECHRPLDYTLTQDGITYVIEAIKDTLIEGREEWNKIHDAYNGTYYEGCRHVEIVRDWAQDLRSYFLDDEIKEIIDSFLDITAPTN